MSNEYTCMLCGLEYKAEDGDPDVGIQAGTPYEYLPDDYLCPLCGAHEDYIQSTDDFWSKEHETF